MFRFQNGSFHLFRLAGIDVSLHWLWFVVAYLRVQSPLEKYSNHLWNLVEYVSLFVIVLTHEFGHALACRQVGGKANKIMLWPLGGIAFVDPPPRPGAVLWSIAAGPLVNVALIPLTVGLWLMGRSLGWQQQLPDLQQYLFMLMFLNGFLLVINLLPIYPLDGGQILQALFWFAIGRAQSLMVASIFGLIGGISIVVLVLIFSVQGQGFDLIFLGIIAAFITLQSWAALQRSRFMLKVENTPKRKDLACPSCGAPPLQGNFWACDECGFRFDLFEHQGICPSCSQRHRQTICLECYKRHSLQEWLPAVVPAEESGEAPLPA